MFDPWVAVRDSHKPTIKEIKEERTIHGLLVYEYFYSPELLNTSDNISSISSKPSSIIY
jgi:hypothetical protein